MIVPSGLELETLTWPAAERVLTPQRVVLIPLGAAAKEHGPHLPLNTDWIQARYFTKRVLERADVVAAPPILYHHYPAFAEYPGSTSLRATTARDLVADLCRSLSLHGPRRFYVLNTGISTLEPLAQAAIELGRAGVLLRFTNPRQILESTRRRIETQAGGTHADEIETSIMLFIAPELADRAAAGKDLQLPDKPGGLTRRPDGPGVYSPTGAWGDPTLATAEKGRALANALVEGIIEEIELLQKAPLPAGATEPGR